MAQLCASALVEAWTQFGLSRQLRLTDPFSGNVSGDLVSSQYTVTIHQSNTLPPGIVPMHAALSWADTKNWTLTMPPFLHSFPSTTPPSLPQSVSLQFSALQFSVPFDSSPSSILLSVQLFLPPQNSPSPSATPHPSTPPPSSFSHSKKPQTVHTPLPFP